MKRFISVLLLLCVLVSQAALASVVEEIPENAIPIDNGMYVVGENFSSGGYTFCIDLNDPDVKELMDANDKVEEEWGSKKYSNGYVTIGAAMRLCKDYATLLDSVRNGQRFDATEDESMHITLIDGMAFQVVLHSVSKAYLIPDKTE